MKLLTRTAVALMASVAAVAPLQAQTTFSFTTTGCFYFGSTGCTAAAAYSTPVVADFGGGISVRYAGVSVTNATPDATGYLALPNLGTFTYAYLSTNPLDLAGQGLNFRLLANFSVPTGVSPNPSIFSTTIDGALKKDNLGALYWSFAPNYYDYTFTGGGSFRMTVVDNQFSRIGCGYACEGPGVQYYNYTVSTNINGTIDCSPGSNAPCAQPVAQSFNEPIGNGTTVTPEPSSYALMAAGLASLGMIARRRRNRA